MSNNVRSEDAEIGTAEWWQVTPRNGVRGTTDTILRLLEQEEISRAKACELLAWERTAPHFGDPPPAPWERLNWSERERAETTERERAAARRIIAGVHGALADAGDLSMPCDLGADLAPAVRELVRQRDVAREAAYCLMVALRGAESAAEALRVELAAGDGGDTP